MRKSQGKKLLEETQAIIQEEGFREKHVEDPEKDFTRSRKLRFVDVMRYVLGNTRQSMELASEGFAWAAGLERITPAAICKARGKIKAEAFREVFERSAEHIRLEESYQGYQVVAIDGMQGELPNVPTLREAYPVRGDAAYPEFHAMAASDVLNGIFLSGDFQGAPADERWMAMELLDRPILQKGKKIFLMDRGFPSVEMLQKLESLGQKYVMRVSRSFLKEVNEFTRSNHVDRVLHISFSKRRGAVNRVKGSLPCELTLRCVRLCFNGNQQICITNLPRKSFPLPKIRELYGFRWGIETGFDRLKNSVFIEEFSSHKLNGIRQDFFATLWATNLISLAVRDAMPDLLKKDF